MLHEELYRLLNRPLLLEFWIDSDVVDYFEEGGVLGVEVRSMQVMFELCDIESSILSRFSFDELKELLYLKFHFLYVFLWNVEI